MSVTMENMLRSMKRLGRVKRRRGRLPKWHYPAGVEREYYRLLFGLVQDITDLVDKELIKQLESLTRERDMNRPQPRTDSWVDRLAAIRARLLVLFGESSRLVKREVPMIASETSQYNRKEMNQTARAALGVEVLLREEWLRELLLSFSQQNKDLITSIPERYLSSVEAIVQQGMRQGMRHEEIAKQIREAGRVTKRRAKFIARDQVSKLNGQLTELRQTEIGLKRYRWRTSLDERVRPSHARREGRIYRWSKPPSGGHPGFDYQCRCTAEPVIEDLVS